MDYLRKAKMLSWILHKKQRRHDGQMYFFHPHRVAESLVTDEDKAIGYLHDVVEDTNVRQSTIDKLFPKYISEGVKAMTHLKGVNYFDYIRAFPKKYIHIKLMDINDNFPTSKESMIPRYEKAINILTSNL